MSGFNEKNTGSELYGLYRQGVDLLDRGDFGAATVSLIKVTKRDPGNLSAREALGRAFFRNSQYEQAAVEFETVVDRQPVNDYAHFCLGRALSLSGESDRALHHLSLAANLSPSRRDYRIYRDRLRASREAGEPEADAA